MKLFVIAGALVTVTCGEVFSAISFHEISVSPLAVESVRIDLEQDGSDDLHIDFELNILGGNDPYVISTLGTSRIASSD